jgi:hypothetical protein
MQELLPLVSIYCKKVTWIILLHFVTINLEEEEEEPIMVDLDVHPLHASLLPVPALVHPNNAVFVGPFIPYVAAGTMFQVYLKVSKQAATVSRNFIKLMKAHGFLILIPMTSVSIAMIPVSQP